MVRLLLRSIFPIVLLFLAMLVGWLFYPRDEPQWAVLDQLHAEWDPATQSLRLSVNIEKRSECVRVLIQKDMSPEVDGGILPTQIPLNGHLPQKLQALPLGQHTVFDIAKPRIKVRPGRYALTVRAQCEKLPSEEPNEQVSAPPVPGIPPAPPSRPLVHAAPVQATVIVPEIKVRFIPPESRLYKPMLRYRARAQ